LTVEDLRQLAGTHDARALGERRERTGDALAGRTVWCTSALPAGDALAGSLSGCLDRTAGVRARRLRLGAVAPLQPLAERLDAMLSGTGAGAPALRRADRALCREGATLSDALAGAGVGPDDVVVLHDSLAAILADAARDRGVHVVWELAIGAHSDEAVVGAWRFLRETAPGADAHLTVWPGIGIAAIMTAPGRVAAKRCNASAAGLGWAAALADIVSGDRDESVGGTRHARPAVAAR
jgi:hypothetical protein